MSTPLVSVEGTANLGRYQFAKLTAVAADATANYAVVDVSDLGALDGAVVQILRSGVDVKADAIVTLNNNGTGTSNGYIKVADGASTYAVTAGDVIYVTAFAAE